MAKETVDKYMCLDSFSLLEFIPGKGQQRCVILYVGDKRIKATVYYDEMCIDGNVIRFSRAKTLKNQPINIFFVCSYCGKRAKKLYYTDDFKCRKCADLLYPLQIADNAEKARIRMIKQYKKLEPDFEGSLKNIADKLKKEGFPPCPKDMKIDKYFKIRVEIMRHFDDFTRSIIKALNK